MSELGTFYRVFWKTGGSNDVDEEVGPLLFAWLLASRDPRAPRPQAHPRLDVLAATDLLLLTDVNGVEIWTAIDQVGAIHKSTPEVRAAWYRRDEIFDREAAEHGGPSWK